MILNHLLVGRYPVWTGAFAEFSCLAHVGSVQFMTFHAESFCGKLGTHTWRSRCTNVAL